MGGCARVWAVGICDLWLWVSLSGILGSGFWRSVRARQPRLTGSKPDELYSFGASNATI